MQLQDTDASFQDADPDLMKEILSILSQVMQVAEDLDIPDPPTHRRHAR